MPAVPVTLHDEAGIVVPFNDEVDPVLPHSNLWRHPVVASGQLVVHLLFKPEFAKLPEVFDTGLVQVERRLEMGDKASPVDVSRRQLVSLERANQIHAVPSTGCGDVEPLSGSCRG